MINISGELREDNPRCLSFRWNFNPQKPFDHFTITNVSGNCGANTDIIIEVKQDPNFTFTFSINGTPEINVLGGSPSADIIDGSTTTTAANGTYFGIVDEGAINSTKAKEVFEDLFNNGGDPEAIVEAKGLRQVSDHGAIEEFVAQAISENPKSVDDYRQGKKAALQYIVGQVMRLSKGKANPQMVGAMISKKLG